MKPTQSVGFAILFPYNYLFQVAIIVSIAVYSLFEFHMIIFRCPAESFTRPTAEDFFLFRKVKQGQAIGKGFFTCCSIIISSTLVSLVFTLWIVNDYFRPHAELSPRQAADNFGPLWKPAVVNSIG